MKKQMTTAMAAAMAFGTVVPAFANEVNLQTTEEKEVIKVDQKLVDGKKIVKNIENEKNVHLRKEVFNYNGTEEDRTDDTLKHEYSGYEVAFVQEDEKAANDKIVLVEKMDLTNAENKASVDKANYDLKMLNAKVAMHKLDTENVNVEERSTQPSIDGGVYKAGTKTWTVNNKESKTVAKYTITGIDTVKDDETTDEEKNECDKLREEVFGLDELTNYTYNFETDKLIVNGEEDEDITKEALYEKYEELLSTIEENKDKFDVYTDEVGAGHTDKRVSVYPKGTTEFNDETLVLSYLVKNEDMYDDSFIVKIPEKNDFTGHWAEDLIVAGMKSGDILLSDTFRPNDSITRAEFAKLITTMYGTYNTIEEVEKAYKDGKISESFSDVPNNAWYAPYVAFVQTNGIAQGTKIDEEFSPNEAITREEAAIMISRMAKIANQDALDKNVEDTNGDGMADTFLRVEDSKFTDIASANAWADHTIEKLATTKFTPKDEKEQTLIKGYEDGTFRPQNEVTRAESLSLITQVLKYNESK